MKIRTTGKMLNSPEARINYMTFRAEDEEDRLALARLYKLYTEGRLDELIAAPTQPPPITKRSVHPAGERKSEAEFSGPYRI